MKYFIYQARSNRAIFTNLRYTGLGAREYSADDHSAGNDAAGITGSYTQYARSANDLYAWYNGALRHVQGAYHYHGGVLTPVHGLTIDSTKFFADSDSGAMSPSGTDLVTISHKMLPDLDRNSITAYDETGFALELVRSDGGGGQGTYSKSYMKLFRVAFFAQSPGENYRLGLSAKFPDDPEYIPSTVFAYTFGALRGQWKFNGTYNAASWTLNNGSMTRPWVLMYTSSISTDIVSPHTGSQRWSVMHLRHSGGNDVETLRIEDKTAFLSEIKTDGGGWKYKYLDQGGLRYYEIKTVDEYIKRWLEDNVWPNT